MIPVRFQRGIELPAQNLWLDPWDAQPFAFVSHAHSDHIGAHREVILSEFTSRLMRERLAGERLEHVLDFEKPARVRDLNVTLLSAGHILGSAQLFLQTAAGSLLYTGDFKLRPGLSAEPVQWRHADTLIMETTFGLPRYRFPPTEQVMAQVVAFCRDTLDDGGVPVLFGYSLGKAQEILCAITQAGLQPMLHASVWKMTHVYQKLRPEFPCDFLKYDARETAGKVLICPPSAARSPMVRQLKNARTAMLTGWAVTPGSKFRYGCDEMFPLSDHADYDDLIRYVEMVQPKRVLTVHGFAAEFAADLRRRGVEAWALSEENQIEMELGQTSHPDPRTPKVEASPSASALSVESCTLSVERSSADSFLAFAALAEKIAATTSKLKKIELLANYLAALAREQSPQSAGRDGSPSRPRGVTSPKKSPPTERLSESSLPALAAIFLTGRAFAQNDPRILQTGWAIIKRALLSASGITETELREISHRHADAGKTAREALEGRTKAEPFSLADTRTFFATLEKTRGPIAKAELLAQRLIRLSAFEAEYLVRILTGDLRIGLKEGLVEESIAAAFAAPLDDVREANMLLGDIGETAALASQAALHQASARLFHPIKVMLASPEPTAESIWSRLSTPAHPLATAVWCEDKFDGIRAQLHRDASRVEIFSRDLRRITPQFDEIVHSARDFPAEVMFDGEIVAFENGRALSFFELQKRLGRKHSSDLFEATAGVPVRFMIFDLLRLDGRSLLKTPLRERRALLEKIALPPRFEIVGVTTAHSAAEIDAAFSSSRLRGNEGLIVKDPGSIYTPGRRGLAWLKLKKELATLDVVVVGVEYGHGKRAQVLSDYTFAVRDEKSGELLTIGKAYSGLTDAEIAEMTEHFLANTLSERGRFRTVKPDVVIEVAFDSVQPSKRHGSGLALRFPRIKAIRRDKTIAEIDTLEFARSLCAPPVESRMSF